jgi:hypothetical protein
MQTADKIESTNTLSRAITRLVDSYIETLGENEVRNPDILAK